MEIIPITGPDGLKEIQFRNLYWPIGPGPVLFGAQAIEVLVPSSILVDESVGILE